MTTKNSPTAQLAALFTKAGDRTALGLVLEDLLTPTEIQTILERWNTLNLLLKGHTHRDVQKEVGISISKVTHAANLLKGGGKGIRALHRKLSEK